MPTVAIKKPKRPLTRAEKQTVALLAAKELAQRSLHHFAHQAWSVVEPDVAFVDGWHIAALCEHLEAVADGRIQNLLVNVPPGTMKSLLVCVFWPAWMWAKQPGKRFMFFSYSESLSLRDSMRTRRVLASEWFQRRWPLQFSESQDAKGKFENAAGGWRMVGSVGGKGTGEHPDFLVADDIHNVLQAESDAERQTVTRWIEQVFATRGVVRDVRRVVIMQRLHVQDASGVLLAKGGWDHVCLPMRFEADRMKPTPLDWNDPRTAAGELLWPAKYPDDKVAALEVAMGLYGAAGQLQQRPSPRGGGTFRREWFEVLTVCPPLKRVARYWDKSGTAGGTGAETAGVAMGTYDDPGVAIPAMREKYVVLDALTFRKGAAEREAVIRQTAQSDRAMWGRVETWVEQEPGSGGKESAEATVGSLAGHDCRVERVTGAKEVRAEPLAAQASVGKVRLLAGAWNGHFLDEMESFPLGKLRDLVDAAGGAFNKLAAPGGGIASASELRSGNMEVDQFEPDTLGEGDF